MKKGQKIWTKEGTRWTIDEIVRPNKHDTYILCSRKMVYEIYNDGTRVIGVELLDIDKQELYPDTPEVRRIMRIIAGHQAAIEKASVMLFSIWISFVGTKTKA